MTMNFNELPEFSKEFKRYYKKYKSLESDLSEFKKIIAEIPQGTGKHFNVITIVGEIKIIKARFFCRYLKGSSLRIVYAYHNDKRMIDFIEIYFKGDKTNEDRERIRVYLKNYSRI